MDRSLSTASYSFEEDNPTKPATKHKKLNQVEDSLHHSQAVLIPGLPDHIAQICLSTVHPNLLYHVCSSWRRLLYSPYFPPFLSLYAIVSPSPSASTQSSSSQTDSIQFYNFDPISSTWDTLPQPPIHFLLHHPSFLSRNLPVQSISVSNNLILMAASTRNLSPALSHPLVFNTHYKVWSFGPPLATPRRWCALGASRGAVYVASGIGSNFSSDVARSVERWDLGGSRKMKDLNFFWEWEKKNDLKDCKFCREAIDAVGWRGKICMVNVKGDAAKEGAVYDTNKDVWEEMPEGMISGWRGPVATMDEQVMYVVDEVKCALRKYNAEKDTWEEIMESERLRGAEQITAKGGRICIVSGGGISVVDVVASPARLWFLDLPEGFEAVAVHIMPRMPVCSNIY